MITFSPTVMETKVLLFDPLCSQLLLLVLSPTINSWNYQCFSVNKLSIQTLTSTLGWLGNLPFFQSAMFLCLIDFECWIKLLFPPLLHFLSWLHHQQLKVSLSKYPLASLATGYCPVTNKISTCISLPQPSWVPVYSCLVGWCPGNITRHPAAKRFSEIYAFNVCLNRNWSH